MSAEDNRPPSGTSLTPSLKKVSKADLDIEFESHVAVIQEAKHTFTPTEQSVIETWLSKLANMNENSAQKQVRNDYANSLRTMTAVDKELVPPFSENPPDGPLEQRYVQKEAQPVTKAAPQSMEARAENSSYAVKITPCSKKKQTGAIPKVKKIEQIPAHLPHKNEFENLTNFLGFYSATLSATFGMVAETFSYIPKVTRRDSPRNSEMARVIAKSKGLPFADFVAAISRYTEDYGESLRNAMRAETGDFRIYVNNILDQRVKDQIAVINQEFDYESQRIKKDIQKWQNELAYLKKRIYEVIPEFDMDRYRFDKNYLNSFFTLENANTLDMNTDDSFSSWKDENNVRIKWYIDNLSKLEQCNQEANRELNALKSQISEIQKKEQMKIQAHVAHMNNESAAIQKLKTELMKVNREVCQAMSQIPGNRKFLI